MVLPMTWSLIAYLVLVVLFTALFIALAYTGALNVVEIIRAVSSYLTILSVTLIGFPLLAVPLMMHVISIAKESVGEKPTKGLYRDFNTACLLVSLGSLMEIILLLLGILLQKTSAWLSLLISSVALGNFVAFTVLFALVVMLLQKIVVELEVVFTR